MSNNIYKTSFLMRSFAGLGSWVFPLAFFFACLFSQNVWGQVSTTVTMSGTPIAGSPFTSLAGAITAINGLTITGPVVATAATGSETAPVGGYVITKTGTITNTITIQGNGAANTIVTASGGQASGVKTDAVFKIVGADYITLQNMRIQENAANTTTAVLTNNMTEFGVGIFLTSATDGAQNNTIQNCIISMSSTYQNASTS